MHRDFYALQLLSDNLNILSHVLHTFNQHIENQVFCDVQGIHIFEQIFKIFQQMPMYQHFASYFVLYNNQEEEQNKEEMSKNKGKDKKGGNDAANGLEGKVQEQKRDLIEQNFTITKLQDKISRMTEEHYDIVTKRDDLQKNYQQKIDKQRIVLENHQNTIERLGKKVNELEIVKLEYQSIIKNQERQVQYLEETRVKEMDEYKKLVQSEMGILESQLKEYNYYMNERDQLYSEKNKLKTNLSQEKNDKLRELADKQREKVQQTDKLKDEMLRKIQQMRQNLLSLKKQQLSTTTRLAVLQNHQLTSQLQFQSKQTEKLLLQNQNLNKKLGNLQKDVEIHKQVQQQLAKRSHISKAIIKKLTNKIAQLEDQLQKSKLQNDTKDKNKKNFEMEGEINRNQEIINILDKNLEEKDKILAKLKTDYQTLQGELEGFKNKMRMTERRSYELSTMMLKYYEDVLNGKIDVKFNDEDQYSFDIRNLKKTPVQEWKLDESRLILTILLNQIRPNLTKHTLGIPTINKSQILVINDEQQEGKFPAIKNHEHSLIRKDSKKFKQVPASSLAPKLVNNQGPREWGRTIHSSSVSNLYKKLKS